MFSIFKKFKEGLSKSAKSIAEKTGGIFGRKKLDASSIEELEEALFASDFGYQTTEEIIEETKNAYSKDKALRGQDVAGIGAAVLTRVLQGSEGRIQFLDEKPTVICLIGVNGSGKTTTTAKLGHQYKANGRNPLLAACDTFRAAAIAHLLLVLSHHQACHHRQARLDRKFLQAVVCGIRYHLVMARAARDDHAESHDCVKPAGIDQKFRRHREFVAARHPLDHDRGIRHSRLPQSRTDSLQQTRNILHIESSRDNADPKVGSVYLKRAWR